MGLFRRLITVAALLSLSLLGLLAASPRARADRRFAEDRIVMVELQVQHAYKCTACAVKIAEIVKKVDGVVKTRAIPSKDAALVFFISGKADIDEMRDVLRREGFVAKVSWGPAAGRLDGRFEDLPINEIPRVRPTVKERREGLRDKPTLPARGYVPPPHETDNLPEADE